MIYMSTMKHNNISHNFVLTFDPPSHKDMYLNIMPQYKVTKNKYKARVLDKVEAPFSVVIPGHKAEMQHYMWPTLSPGPEKKCEQLYWMFHI